MNENGFISSRFQSTTSSVQTYITNLEIIGIASQLDLL
jgi:hypothetical protein